ncbi:DUF6406 domain-containing protein [Actinomadura luteofluorescens]|uniref:DUF6406 domain-containing protein n=1 Tax=Actinomadura luteofluorescens TaxID=46163 RepID=UPI00347CF77E
MALEKIGLQHGTQAHLGAGMKLGLVHVSERRDGGPPEIVLFVKDSGENELTLHPGDTFPVGDQIWKFDNIRDAGGNRLGASFSRVE